MAEEETKFAERLDELTEVTFTQPDKVKKIGAGDYLIDITVPVPVMKHRYPNALVLVYNLLLRLVQEL